MHAAVIASDPSDRDFLAYALRQGGFTVTQRSSIKGLAPLMDQDDLALIVMETEDPAAAVSDLKALRKKSDAPLIVLGEGVTEKTTCDLLEAGGDLVLQSPCSPRLLITYGHRLLRRSRTVHVGSLSTLDLGSIRLNPATFTVHVQDRSAKRLTPLEFRLLHLLMTSRGTAISTDMIVERVWGYSERGNRELVRGLVSRLRAKVEDNPSTPNYIHTIPGVGYLFEVDPD
jgi:DNA-binding response OmpR family regulator